MLCLDFDEAAYRKEEEGLRPGKGQRFGLAVDKAGKSGGACMFGFMVRSWEFGSSRL